MSEQHFPLWLRRTGFAGLFGRSAAAGCREQASVRRLVTIRLQARNASTARHMRHMRQASGSSWLKNPHDSRRESLRSVEREKAGGQ